MSEQSILFVDDDEELLESFTKWFSRQGFQVTTAHHPNLALLSSAYNTFDAAVVDITLPEMNGIELIDRLKGIGDFPIIVLSGDNSPMLRDAATKRGVFHVLVKPASLSVVEQVVRESINDSTPPISSA